MTLGCVTICSTRKMRAYHHLANVTMLMHQLVWYGELSDPVMQRQVRAADVVVADALSRVDPTPVEE